jgi:enoyl-CoA hydratase/carnithine racemase
VIDYDRRDDVAWVTIDRPERKNALSPSDHRAVASALERAEAESRVAVLTAAGDDVFCAGSDLGALREARATGDAESLVDAEFALHRRIEDLDVPVVAAVNGSAYGGGLELVAACDLAVAVDGATFSLPETRLGLTPGYALDRAVALVGRKRLLELALTGEPIDAATAREWGLVNRVVEPSALHATVTDLATSVADAPPHAISAVKRTVNEPIRDDVSYQRSVDRLASLLAETETQARLDAFFDDRETETGSGGESETESDGE